MWDVVGGDNDDIRVEACGAVPTGGAAPFKKKSKIFSFFLWGRGLILLGVIRGYFLIRGSGVFFFFFFKKILIFFCSSQKNSIFEVWEVLF